MRNFLKVMIVLMGIILGIYLGELTSQIEWLKFLSYGRDLGVANPLTLNLVFLEITFGFITKLNIAGIVGFIVSLFIVKKVR